MHSKHITLTPSCTILLTVRLGGYFEKLALVPHVRYGRYNLCSYTHWHLLSPVATHKGKLNKQLGYLVGNAGFAYAFCPHPRAWHYRKIDGSPH